MNIKQVIVTFILLSALWGCKNNGAEQTTTKEEVTSSASPQIDADYYEYTIEGLSDKYVGLYNISELLVSKEWSYYSIYNSDVHFDSLRQEKVGYEGSVDIENFSKRGFDFSINVIDYSHCNGGINGKAVFNSSNRAYSTSIENDYATDCLLTFTFLHDTLLVNQRNCTEWHGGSCQFEAVYLLSK